MKFKHCFVILNLFDTQGLLCKEEYLLKICVLVKDENGSDTDGYCRYHICVSYFWSDSDLNTDNVNHIG